MPYSIDLRKRVVCAIANGMSQTKASDVYKVCRKTIYSWLLLEKETGQLEPKTHFQKGHSHGITDLNAFKKFVDEHPDLTQEEMAHYFSVGSSTIGRTLKRLNYSRKKRAQLTQNETKQNAKPISRK